MIFTFNEAHRYYMMHWLNLRDGSGNKHAALPVHAWIMHNCYACEYAYSLLSAYEKGMISPIRCLKCPITVFRNAATRTMDKVPCEQNGPYNEWLHCSSLERRKILAVEIAALEWSEP